MNYLIKFIIVFILLNCFAYGLGSFIAFDFSPLNWWMFTSTWGRIITLILEVVFIGMAIDIVDKSWN